MHFNTLAALAAAVVPPALVAAFPPSYGGGIAYNESNVVTKTTCNGQTYVYQELAGYGYLPSDARDITGDTLGGIGSSTAFEQGTWRKLPNGSYTGILWTLPDRGWNTGGTLNYQNRVHKIRVMLNPEPDASLTDPSGPNLYLTYLGTVLFRDPTGNPTTGLDADDRGPYLQFPNLPVTPSATYPGDGYGGPGPGGRRVSVDSEGLVIGHDGSFWVSDEYGPYIYKFDKTGRMQTAIRPPDAFIPLRNGSDSFASDNPPVYDPDRVIIPEDNPTGRDNNHGFEGLTSNPEGTKLYTLLQAGLNQEGGLKNSQERLARFLVYDISGAEPAYEAEYVVVLPPVNASDPKSDIAAQSEIHYISPTQFLVLSRDGDAGAGQDETESLYRHADVFDISAATNFKGAAADCYTCAIGSKKGVLNSTITPATYCSWLDFNINSQLERFGVHNGGAQDSGLLNEKWESLALAPVNPGKKDGSSSAADNDYFLFSFSDNDFITQNGYMRRGTYRYQDASGFSLKNQALVFKVKLPQGSQPLSA